MREQWQNISKCWQIIMVAHSVVSYVGDHTVRTVPKALTSRAGHAKPEEVGKSKYEPIKPALPPVALPLD
jgi:hypothetical protein